MSVIFFWQRTRGLCNNCLKYIIINLIAVVEELRRYKHENQIDATAFLDRNLKMVAFNFARQSNHPAFIKMMVIIYELPNDKDMFIDKVREIIQEHNYKDVMKINEYLIFFYHQHKIYKNREFSIYLYFQACQFAHDLELHDSFTIFDFAFPLVLQDKINIAEPYLEQAKSSQLPLVELLDSLLDRSSSVYNMCDPYIG